MGATQTNFCAGEHGPAPVIAVRGLSKSFGRVRANTDITLTFRPGTIKALLGENGAGKSTLMSMLAGKLQPDSGCITADGAPVRFKSPADAFRAGIGMVYQHFMLVDSMTVAENILLGQTEGFTLSPGPMRNEVAGLASKYGIAIDPAARVRDLSMGERQRVEILKLLRRNSSLLIFDEPTAVLTPGESEQLFASLRCMAALGKSVVFISHKLQEVLDIADEIAILRKGEVVDEFSIGNVPDAAALAGRMIGRHLDLGGGGHERVAPGEEALTVEGLSASGLAEISFSLRKGEVLAIAGVAGNGQKELVEVLAGLSEPGKGQVTILGQSWKNFYSRPPRVGGLAYIPEDRRGLATCPGLSLVDNLLLTARTLFTEGLFLSRSAALAAVKQLISAYSIVPGDPLAEARSLSGGNLQKLVIGRELLRQPSVIIAENPTQGLDVAATEEVWTRLKAARNQAGILLVTGDMAEALHLADRIAVMYRGRFMDCFSRDDKAKVDAIGLMMAGVTP